MTTSALLSVQVFAEIFEARVPQLFSEEDIERIFGPTREIAEIAQRIFSSLENAVEVAESSHKLPDVGAIYGELTEVR